ncbi:MAG: phage regulatory CII family protein [Inhella sp.]
MSVSDAAYNVVREYPGGAAALQLRMGKSNLSGEVNPNVKTAKLSIEDAVTVSNLANDYRILYAFAADCRHFPPMPMPDGLDVAGDQCIRTVSELVKESADVVAATVEGLADNEVSDNDLARFDREAGELIVKLQQLRLQLANKNATLKARP